MENDEYRGFIVTINGDSYPLFSRNNSIVYFPYARYFIGKPLDVVLEWFIDIRGAKIKEQK